MRKIKVLLAIRPRMLLEVVKHLIERQPDMEVVGELTDPTELFLAIKTTKAEVIIVTTADSGQEPEVCGDLLELYPQLKIMALSGDGDLAVLYTSNSSQKRLDDIGEASILGAIREFGL